MIALKDLTFRSTYRTIQAPSKDEAQASRTKMLEAHILNESIVNAITRQLESKINNLSKKYNWRDKFSFIKTVDYSLVKYKKLIKLLEENIFLPFENEEKQDILGRAYRIFLSKAGKVDNKNIILTPDHIKSLMVKLARLTVDDVVLDTCTGSGGFLMESMETMIELAQGNETKIEHIKDFQLIGFEIDSVLFALACSNMFLHGDGRTNLIYRSSLLNDDHDNIINSDDKELLTFIRKCKPTKVIINPPYENNKPIKFALQAMDYLETYGKLIIIMPTPTLTHNQKGRIDKYKKWPELEESILKTIFNRTEIPGVCERRSIYKGNILNCAGIYPKKSSTYEMIKIGSLFTYQRGSLASESNDDSGKYDFITASTEWKKHSDFSHDCEAIIFAVSASGSLGRTHYVNGKFIASNLCLVLQPKNKKYKIDLKFYKFYFDSIRTRLRADLADGTSKLTIDPNDLMEYYIEYSI